MRCLCCNKIIKEGATEYEKSKEWHRECIKRFFNIEEIPKIDLRDDAIKESAIDNIDKGNAVAGVQKKILLSLDKTEYKLTTTGKDTEYILKPQTKEYENLPENEHLVMCLADSLSIKTVPHALIYDKETCAYITKRVDRKEKEKDGYIDKIAMEDFCQLSEKLTEDKYRSSYEKCAKVIKEYSSMIEEDLSSLYYVLLFCFITGNSDMHLKNFSLLEDRNNKRSYSLSPFYDLVSVNVAFPEDREEFALTMNGKKTKLKREDFIKFGTTIGIKERVCISLIEKITSAVPSLIKICKEADFINEELKEKLISLIENRCSRLMTK